MEKKFPFKILSVFILINSTLLLCACGTNLWVNDIEQVNLISEPARLRLKIHHTGQFSLYSRERYDNPGQDLTIYLEGDGVAWVSRTEPSRNPTPDDPIALRLATLDSSPNIVWIARPCQYITKKENPTCDPYYWTLGRLAPEVVKAVDTAITVAKHSAKASKIHLVGYSGGGGLSMLIAAERNDIASIRTVAGNIDHAAFTSLHRVTPLRHSLDPASVAWRIRKIPQWHFFGDRDKIVPKSIGDSYLSKGGESHCAKIRALAEVTHNKGWDQVWRNLLEETKLDEINQICK